MLLNNLIPHVQIFQLGIPCIKRIHIHLLTGIYNILINYYFELQIPKDETKYINILKNIQDIDNKKGNYNKVINKLQRIIEPLNTILQKQTKKLLKIN